MNGPQHRCITAAACRNAERDEQGKRRGTLVAAPDTVCDTCRAHIEACIGDMVRDWWHLELAIGDRQTSGAEKVTGTPTPAIPLNTTAAALQGDILEAAERAAELVSDKLHTDPPTGQRKTPSNAAHGSLAWQSSHERRPRELQTLAAAARLVAPNIDMLLDPTKRDAVIWLRPRRCPQHAHAIETAETALAAAVAADPDMATALARTVDTARAAAGSCDECSGWGQHGQARALTEMSGVDIAVRIINLHRQVREHLGKTRLRHHYAMPCPASDKHGDYCGALTVGRWDGADCIDCTSCGAQWTEREYEFLSGLVLEEIEQQEENDMLRWLLAEAYWRLDDIRSCCELISEEERANLPGAAVVAEAVERALTAGTGHRNPEQRRAAA